MGQVVNRGLVSPRARCGNVDAQIAGRALSGLNEQHVTLAKLAQSALKLKGLEASSWKVGNSEVNLSVYSSLQFT